MWVCWQLFKRDVKIFRPLGLQEAVRMHYTLAFCFSQATDVCKIRSITLSIPLEVSSNMIEVGGGMHYVY